VVDEKKKKKDLLSLSCQWLIFPVIRQAVDALLSLFWLSSSRPLALRRCTRENEQRVKAGSWCGLER